MTVGSAVKPVSSYCFFTFSHFLLDFIQVWIFSVLSSIQWPARTVQLQIIVQNMCWTTTLNRKTLQCKKASIKKVRGILFHKLSFQTWKSCLILINEVEKESRERCIFQPHSICDLYTSMVVPCASLLPNLMTKELDFKRLFTNPATNGTAVATIE